MPRTWPPGIEFSPVAPTSALEDYVFWTKNDARSYETTSDRLAATLDWVMMIERVARSPIPRRHFTDVSAIHAVTSELVLEGPIRTAKELEDRSPNPYPEIVIVVEPVEGWFTPCTDSGALES